MRPPHWGTRSQGANGICDAQYLTEKPDATTTAFGHVTRRLVSWRRCFSARQPNHVNGPAAVYELTALAGQVPHRSVTVMAAMEQVALEQAAVVQMPHHPVTATAAMGQAVMGHSSRRSVAAVEQAAVGQVSHHPVMVRALALASTVISAARWQTLLAVNKQQQWVVGS
jgi:formylglycine-generating enzyme required for sulfatase activity